MELNELINKYGKEKAEYDALKKVVDADNLAIKDIMLKEGDEVKKETDEYKASCKVVVSENFNENMLVNRLHKIWSENNGSIECPWTKIVYVPNMEEIENAIYSGELDPTLIADCKETKTQVRLTVSKLKK